MHVPVAEAVGQRGCARSTDCMWLRAGLRSACAWRERGTAGCGFLCSHFFVLLTTDAMYCWVPSFSTSAAECRSTCVFLTFFFLALQSETIYFRYSYLEQVSLAGCFLTHVGFCQHPLCPCRHKLHSFGRRIQRLWLRSHSCINN